MDKHLLRILRGFIAMVAIALATVIFIVVTIYTFLSVVGTLFCFIEGIDPPWHMLIVGGAILFSAFLRLCYHIGSTSEVREFLDKL